MWGYLQRAVVALTRPSSVALGSLVWAQRPAPEWRAALLLAASLMPLTWQQDGIGGLTGDTVPGVPSWLHGPSPFKPD